MHSIICADAIRLEFAHVCMFFYIAERHSSNKCDILSNKHAFLMIIDYYWRHEINCFCAVKNVSIKWLSYTIYYNALICIWNIMIKLPDHFCSLCGKSIITILGGRFVLYWYWWLLLRLQQTRTNTYKSNTESPIMPTNAMGKWVFTLGKTQINNSVWY